MSMNKKIVISIFIFISIVIATSFSFAADQSLCAEVQIEIRQELTLERQAFDAHMRINNGLTHISIDNVNVTVNFTDENGNPVLASSDPNNTSALFFISLDTMNNINDVNGTGTVAPSTSADIHWLIIPAEGASNGVQEGTLYYVGATLTYTLGGEDHVTEVSHDYIFVKPMPELTLDYFLPTDVYGDDAFTTEIEPPVPFNLGVRVKNSGAGTARNLKIDSAQPKIVENELGLLIGFAIEGSEVNGTPATNSLLVNFGNIAPNTSGTARWIMTCSLSGQFTEFTADFSHSDELGGELTSLMEAVNTHFLVHDVLVDLPGRDTIRDFFAKDGGVYKVYESDSVDTDVTDQSAFSNLQISGIFGTLTTPVTAGFMYVKLSDPFAGQKVIKSVVRSDGKLINANNAWLSKTRDENNNWLYYFNIFDVNTTDSYTITFEDISKGPQPPVLQFIPDKTGIEDQQISFIVEASDPSGTIPALSVSPKPARVVFIDQGNIGNGIATGIFDWTPAAGQAGRYEITFTASDGVLTDSQRVVITIYSTVPDYHIFGNCLNYPEPGFSASMSMDVSTSSPGTSWFKYYYSKQRLNFVSTSASGVSFNGNTVTVTGEGTVNGAAGYGFKAIISDDNPDTVEIAIYNPDGTVYFTANPSPSDTCNINVQSETQYQLVTAIDPPGAGSVSPDCSIICWYDSGTAATLTATENNGYMFSNWSGCDSASNNVCTMTLNADKTVTAMFSGCLDPVRIAGATPVYYSTLLEAYNAANGGDVLEVQAISITGNMTIDKSVTLKGGFNCDYSVVTGKTTINGNVTVNNGTAVIENFVLE